MVLSWRTTVHDLQCDIQQYSESGGSLLGQALRNLYSHPAFAAVIYYRLGRWAWAARPAPIPHGLYIVYRVFYPLVRWYSGVELQARTQIGPGLCVLHFGPTIIHPDTIAGENLVVLPGVVIGAARGGTPCIGSDVQVGAGAKIIGPVHVGDHVSVGAGSVVTRDLPDNCTAVGIPARPVGRQSDFYDQIENN